MEERKRINLSFNNEQFELIKILSEINNKKITTYVKKIVDKEITKYLTNIEFYRKQKNINLLLEEILKMLPEIKILLPKNKGFENKIRNLAKQNKRKELIEELKEFRKNIKNNDWLLNKINEYLSEIEIIKIKPINHKKEQIERINKYIWTEEDKMQEKFM